MAEVARTTTPRQDRAIAAILDRQSREGAAAAAGVSPRTVFRWLKDETFTAELRRQRQGAADSVATILIAGARGAAESLIEIAVGTVRGSPERVAACRAVLTLSTAYVDQVEIAERLDRIEAALAARTSNPTGAWS